jgi:hypothetical protein
VLGGFRLESLEDGDSKPTSYRIYIQATETNTTKDTKQEEDI